MTNPGTGPPRARPLVIGRGGAPHAAPSHTLPALEAALAQGADGLALEVRLTADEQVVATAGPHVDTGPGPGPAVDRLTLRELKRLSVGARWRWPRRVGRAGSAVQALGEIVERFRERASLLIILPAGSDLLPGIEERVTGLLQLCDLRQGVSIASPDHHALRRCRALDHEVPLVALIGARPLDPSALAGPDRPITALGLPAGLLVQDDVEACRKAGLGCQAWGVEGPEQARRVAAWGVTALVTDHPGRVRAGLEHG